jgi:hypothetical protein
MARKKKDPNALGGINWSKYEDRKAQKTAKDSREVITQANSNVSRQLFKVNSDSSITPPMIATGAELWKYPKLLDLSPESTRETLLKEKLSNADSDTDWRNMYGGQMGHYGGLTESIRQHGYDWSEPVAIHAHNLELVDGHHRAAVMNRENPHEFIPLRYTGRMVDNDRLEAERSDYAKTAEKYGHRTANNMYPLDKFPHLKNIYKTE